MSIIKKGYTLQGNGLPEICIAVCYYADKTAKMYTRDGSTWNQVMQVDESKWQPVKVPDADAQLVINGSGAETVEFFELTAEARQRKGTGFTTK